MKKETIIVDPSVFLRLASDDPNKVEIVDNFNLTPEARKMLLDPYITSLYESLALRAKEPSLGVPRYAFNEYLSMPGLIGERIFSMFDKDADSILKKEEFQKSFSRLFATSFEEIIRFIFDLFDFDADGKASKEDFRILLSHVPLVKILELINAGGKCEGLYTKYGDSLYLFLDRLQSQQEIVKLLDKCMKNRQTLTFPEFVHMTEHESSIIYLCMFLLLRRSCSAYRDFALYCSTRTAEEDSLKRVTPKLVSKKLLPSPELHTATKLSPLSSLQRLTSSKKETHSVLQRVTSSKMQAHSIPLKEKPVKKDEEEEDKTPKATGVYPIFKKFKHTPYIDAKSLTASPINDTEGVREGGFQNTSFKEECKRVLSLPVADSSSQKQDQKATVVLCVCGNKCKENETGCEACLENLRGVTCSGYLYENSNTGSLIRKWYKLLGNHLYRYNFKTDKDYVAMYTLSGSLIRDELEQLILARTVAYPFRIFFGHSFLHLYSIKKEEKVKWIQALKEAIGYANLSDFYELKLPLGKGKFGTVRAAIHKQSGAEVAVKIVNKSKLSAEELNLAKREIEILKLCQHPNVIRLLDVFENPDYIYTVMELLQGGDLYEYLVRKNFKVTEARARNITHALATALYYIHSYGIVHRDIKLDNVLMADESDDSEVKLVDFGLSKMIGPGEYCHEPFGTYGYAAPEVLEQDPYNSAVDIWGLGVILYILLAGRPPFEDISEERVAWFLFA